MTTKLQNLEKLNKLKYLKFWLSFNPFRNSYEDEKFYSQQFSVCFATIYLNGFLTIVRTIVTTDFPR